ncbi:hypothetical protein COO60DRAFT_314958 [Scenedesmus sp. NREL 46B-D3]|nr:hypothetical protein COO60DRAFT_314958 [Scenedesmus sp. NREL 46B-D3]
MIAATPMTEVCSAKVRALRPAFCAQGTASGTYSTYVFDVSYVLISERCFLQTRQRSPAVQEYCSAAPVMHAFAVQPLQKIQQSSHSASCRHSAQHVPHQLWARLRSSNSSSTSNSRSRLLYRGGCTARGSGSGNSICAGPIIDRPPVFDEPARVPTSEEAAAVSAGARLTPEQQLAQQLQLPLTLRIRGQPGAPNERQLMERIKAADTWQQLEVLLYKHARQRPRAAANTHAAMGGTASAAAAPSSATAAAASDSIAESQAGQQQHASKPLAPQQKRRRQQPQPLSVQVQPQQQQRQVLLQTTSPTAAATTSQPKPSDALNHLHVTEAFRRLTHLLPANPTALHPTERARAAALISFLCAQALALAHTLELDPRGIAHVAAAVAKLGHRDEALTAELQLAALLQVDGFVAQHVAMLLGALVGMRARPDSQMFQAMQQHVAGSLHQYKHQSMASTIWALAKLSNTGSTEPAAAGSTSSAATGSGSTSSTVSRDLVAALVCRCQPQMHFWSPRDLSQAAWGLARLGAKPSQEWCRSLLLACQKCLTKMTPQDLANTISALPELGAAPEQAWLDAFCTTAAAKMPQASPMALHAILFGLARVRQAERRTTAAAVKQRRVAAAREQQQQAQQQGDMAHPQAPADTAAAQENAGHPAAELSPPAALPAAKGMQMLHAGAAQVKLLRAAVLWLLRMQQHLTHRQLAGVIMSLGEVLPHDVLRELHGGAELGDGQMQQQLQAVAEPRLLQASSPQQGSKAADAITQQQRQDQLVDALRQLIVGWRQLIVQGQLAAVLPKRQSKLLEVAWQRLSPSAAVIPAILPDVEGRNGCISASEREVI